MGFASNIDPEKRWRYFKAQMLIEKSIPIAYWDTLNAREIGDIIAYIDGTSRGRTAKAKKRAG